MPSANMNTIGGLSVENKTFYNRTLLRRLLPQLVFAKYGQKKALPKNEGDTVSFRRVESLEPATTPLTEGVTPDGSKLKISEVKATVQQYGDYVEVSDKLDLIGIDPIITETAEILGEQAGLTIDNVVRNGVCAGTTVQFAGGKLSTESITATDKITYAEIKKAVKTLKNNNVKPLEGNSYIGIIDPDTESDITDDPMWVDISKYNGGVKIMDGEIGKLAGVRFVVTTETLVKAGASDLPVHCSMIIGKDAYGVVDVENSTSKPQIIVKPFGSSGTEDPLNQRQTQGWKAFFTSIRLNELNMVRLEHAVSE